MKFSVLSLSHVCAIEKGQTLTAGTQGAKEADLSTRFYFACIIKEYPSNSILTMDVPQTILIREFAM